MSGSSRVRRKGLTLLGALLVGSAASAAPDETTAPTPAPSAPAEEPSGPWRLDDALGTPDWLEVSGEIRLRYEGISGQFRSSSRLDNSDHLVFSRTLLAARANFESTALGVELIDARHFGGSNGSQLNTSNVNTLDVLQAYGELRIGEDREHRLRVGRQTLDLGSRRLVARNRYRNTINAFSGVTSLWQLPNDRGSVEAFWLLPTRRRSSKLSSNVDNRPRSDMEDVDLQFAGVFHERKIGDDHALEMYAYYLFEDERARERQLLTPGLRWRRAPATGAVDYEFEGAYQFGRSRSSAGAARQDHRAHFQHLSVGYTFDATWKPRVRLALDHASGDGDPTDGDNERFDTLFGARRFEYGPTGIYGAIARSNIISPELRLVLRPRDRVQWMWAVRRLYLARDRDAWTTSGVQDPSGKADRHVGDQIETRVRWDIPEPDLRLECGVALMLDGDFQREAPGGQDSDTVYGYVQARWRF